MDDRGRREVHALAHMTSELSQSQQVFFQSAYWRLRRNPTTALVLCLLLGNFGAHCFYLGRRRSGVVRLLFCWTLIPWVVALVEAGTIAQDAMHDNGSLAKELLAALKASQERVAAAATLTPAVAAATPNASRYEAALEPARASDDVEMLTREPATTLPRVAEIIGAGALAAAVAGVAQRAEDADASSAAVNERASQPVSNDLHEDRLSAAAWQGGVVDADDRHDATATAAPAEEQAAPLCAANADVQAPVPQPFAAPQTAPLAPIAASYSAALEPPTASAYTTKPLPAWQLSDAHDDADGTTFSDEPPSPDTLGAGWVSGAYLGVTTLLKRAATGHATGQGTQAEDVDVANETQQHVIEPLQERGEVGDAEPARVDPGTWDSTGERDASTDTLGWNARPVGNEWGATQPSASAVAETEEPEPVFMYQLDAAIRHDPVHLGPPAKVTADEDWAEEPKYVAAGETSDSFPTAPDDVSHAPATKDRPSEDILLLGPALAAGLADLLRERPSRTRPRTTGGPTLATDASLFAPVAPLARAHASPETVDASSSAADESHEIAPDGSAPYGPPGGLDDELPHSVPATVPQHLQQALNGIRESTSTAPAAAYVTTPSKHIRRRVVQRVIVRKMAVVDGRVVAESSVERQVQVVRDEDEMAERIHEATNEAAREALEHLIAQAPEEALPAIRMQLYALDNASSVSNFQGNGVLSSPRR